MCIQSVLSNLFLFISKSAMASWFHSRRKLYFQLVLALLILSVLGLVFFKVYGFFVNQQIKDQQVVLTDQTKIVDTYKALTGYNKLQAVKLLETKQSDIPWSDHINKVIQMLEDLKGVQGSATDTITLSDFKVDLNKISLKGEVSNLLLLYYSNSQKGVVSLLDRFGQLDFIKDIRIQTYDKVGDAGAFQFVLEANVVNNGTGTTK